MYAMTHVAVHDALNAIDRRSQPYAFHPPPRPAASPRAAVAAAAHGVLVPALQDLPDIFPPECIAAGVQLVEDASQFGAHRPTASPAAGTPATSTR